MAVKWGEAEIEVHVDGKSLPEETAALAAGAGRIGGDSFNKSFAQRLKAGLSRTFDRIKGWFTGLWGRLFKRSGKNLGDGFTDGFKESMKTFKLEFDKFTTDIAKRSTDVDFSKWGDDLGNLRRVFPEITDGFKQMAIEGNKGLKVWEPMIDDIGELKQVFDDTGDSARGAAGDFRILWRELESGSGSTDKAEKSSGRLRNTMRRLRSSAGGFGERLKTIAGGFGNFIGGMDGITKAGGRQGSMWKRLSANTRQWTLIIGAVIGAMGDLAVLGSAAGAGILVMVGALAGAGTAAVFAAVAFSRFVGDIEKVPEGLKDSRKAFDDFRKTFSKVMDEMTTHAFQDTVDAWKRFGDVAKELQPAFNKIGDVVNGLIKDLAKNLDTSRVEKLNKFLSVGADVLDRVVRAAGRLGDALLTAFTSPAFLRAQEGFLTWLDKLVDKFAAFVNGPGFEEWFGHAESVFAALEPLLNTVGTLLNNMVTDETVGQLVDFIGHLDSFLKGPGADILEFAQELDVFGLLAEALDTLGAALAPLGPPLIEMADAFNEIISTAIDTLAPIIEDIAKALAPLVTNVANFMKENPQLFADVLLAIAAGFIAIKAVGIAANVTKAISGFVGVAGKKNTSKLVGFATAIAGISLALQGLAEQNQAGGGFEGGGLGVLETIAGGALAGAFAGLPGILIGGLIGAVASMIQDMFLSPEIDGAWKTGWDQLFDPTNFEGGGIGPLKEWFATDFANAISTGWQTAMGAITGFFASMNETTLAWQTQAEEGWATFWAGVGTFFDEAITNILGAITSFFADMNANTVAWWASVTAGWNTFWGNVRSAFQTGLNNVMTAITTGLATMNANIRAWWADVVAGWNRFWGDVGRNIQSGWTAVTGFFTSTFANLMGIWNGFWQGLTSAVNTAVGNVTSAVGRLLAPIRNAISQVQGFMGQVGKVAGSVFGGGAAAGTILMGPRRILAGEAGPEAIVPLRRPLSQVDPSVRWLSAIAQGQPMAMGKGGAIGGGRTLNVEPGAIVIQGVLDPNAAALGVVNRLAERIAG